MKVERLLELAEEHERKARSIRDTIAVINEHEGQRAINGFGSVMNGAMKLRGGPGSRGPYTKRRKRRTREQIDADNLAALTARQANGAMTALIHKDDDEDQPTLPLAPRSHHKKGKGPKRQLPITEQPGYHSTDKVTQRRTRMAAILAGMSKTEPVADLGRLTGVMTRYGYVKRQGDGFVRTDKEFHIGKQR